MRLKPYPTLTDTEVQSGLRLVTRDGLFSEAMVALTSGTFLIAMAMQMGASNLQIGVLAALPTLSNIFQLASIWLVQRYNNRRAISVICSFLARFPLFIIGIMPFVMPVGTSVNTLLFLLFFHCMFGSVSGASWNSWMKDLVPAEKLGTYFSYRTRLVQGMNVVLSVLAAWSLDFIKTHSPENEAAAYPLMFVAGGVLGMLGVYTLYRTPEPQGHLQSGNLFGMLRKPLRDVNFRKLLIFNSAWAFSLNLATPFFSVYLLKTLDISLTAVIGLNIISSLSSILFLKIWGEYSDRFSNKTVIRICAPLYIACIVGWTLVGNHSFTIPFLIAIHVVSGITTGGINLAITNIGLKLATKEEAVVYIAMRNMINAFIPALAPIMGGLLADALVSGQLVLDYSVTMTMSGSLVTVLKLTNWTFFFTVSALLAFMSLRFLRTLHEEGEIGKEVVLTMMAVSVKRTIRQKEYRLVRAFTKRGPRGRWTQNSTVR